MDTLVVPIPLLRRLLALLRGRGSRPLFLRVGVRDTSEGRDWLAHEIVTDMTRDPSHVFEVRSMDATGADDRAAVRRSRAMVGCLLVGTGPRRGRIAISTLGGHWGPIERLSLVGPGMHMLDLGSAPVRAIAALDGVDRPADARERWSRTIGALGGEAVWRRLVGLKMIVVGAGRSGSLVASSLARLGVRRLTIVDPDVVELHNLGEADAIDDTDIGLPKAMAVARQVSRALSRTGVSIEPLVASVTDPIAIGAAKRADVILSCVDHDAPRLAVALVAVAHHRVLLDIGTGVFLDAGGTTRHVVGDSAAGRGRRMGADVRLVLPGSCLLCQGGFTDYEGALQALTVGRSGSDPREAFGGSRGRAGSLRSLNLLASGTAIRLVEDLVAGRVERSVWAHLALDERGLCSVKYPMIERSSPVSVDCRLCARAGLGDLAL